MKLKHCLAGTMLVVGLTACATVTRPDLSGMSFSTAPLVGKVVWHDLITEDIDAARPFYEGLFGWSFEDATGPGRRGYALARSGNVYVAGFVPVAARADGSRLSRWLPYLSVTDVDQAVTDGVGGRCPGSRCGEGREPRPGRGDRRSRRCSHRRCKKRGRGSG